MSHSSLTGSFVILSVSHTFTLTSHTHSHPVPHSYTFLTPFIHTFLSYPFILLSHSIYICLIMVHPISYLFTPIPLSHAFTALSHTYSHPSLIPICTSVSRYFTSLSHNIPSHTYSHLYPCLTHSQPCLTLFTLLSHTIHTCLSPIHSLLSHRIYIFVS